MMLTNAKLANSFLIFKLFNFLSIQKLWIGSSRYSTSANRHLAKKHSVHRVVTNSNLPDNSC